MSHSTFKFQLNYGHRQAGRGVLFIDQKGDLETIEQFTSFVRTAGRLDDLKVFSLAAHDKSSGYNLLNNGSATELRARIMGSLIWSEEFYKNQAAGFLMSLLIGLVWLRDNRALKLDLGVALSCLQKSNAILNYLEEIPQEIEKVRFHLESAHMFLKNPDDFKSLQVYAFSLAQSFIQTLATACCLHQTASISLKLSAEEKLRSCF